ncbi:vitamin B12-transporter protein BtuF [Stieleria neptunia]|uniref:Vitamin B12-transporter protein BtuF n=1 Tax=Stieleria neptunia TaxID=2527979 RepID=A0A518HV18_9BACT|nr:cobalamin-binding protein [Stieleria neptunia]QDV44702.1 vitamin B12-transporter protein BtuF [Stieleria neptunia]
MRIISLLPSATEIVCALGLRDQLVGVSHECDFPTSVSDLPKVTRTIIPGDASSSEIDALVREQLQQQRSLYSLDVPLVRSLAPDLIVTQTLCDVCAVSEGEVKQALCDLSGDTRVVHLEPACLADVLNSIRQVAVAARCDGRAEDCLNRLNLRLQKVKERSQTIHHRPSVMLLEWIDPPFSAGHWNPELVELAGGTGIIGVAGERSVGVDWERVVSADPDVMLIACCGFDVQRSLKDVSRLQSFPGWSSLRCVQSGRVFVVDGSAYFNRPGPRLVDSLEILAHTLHPQVHPLPDGLPESLQISNGSSER